MPKAIVPDETGGILHLPDALELHATGKVIIYARVSSSSQKCNGSLANQAAVEEHAILAMVGPSKLMGVVRAVEYGQINMKRTHLRRAIEAARKVNAILCARDVSRFIRAEAYDRRTNHDAQPAAEEHYKLWKLAGGVMLASREDPTLTEAERHSAATKANPRCGRPPEPLDPKLALRILEELGLPSRRCGCVIWDNSIAEVAKRFKVSKAKVQRLLDALVPKHLCKGNTLRWKELNNPARAYRLAMNDPGQVSLFE